MPHPVTIETVAALGAWVEEFSRAATVEGFRFIDRLADEWRSGANRFDATGERLVLARVGSAAVGVCGLNVDPYAADGRTGRLRHLYVLPEQRRAGVGRLLVADLLASAPSSFARVRLRATDGSQHFHAALGFVRCDAPEATHVVEFRR